jgi:2TM domain
MTTRRNSAKMHLPMPVEANRRTYTEQQVAEILKRAMAQGLKTDALTHADLIEMARELDIDQHALEAACEEVAEKTEAAIEQRTLNEELSAERTRRFWSFLSSLVTYLVVNAGLYFINTRYFPGEWFYGVLAIWGIMLLLQLRSVISPERSLERRKRRELRRKKKEQRRLEREQWRHRLRAAWMPPAIEHRHRPAGPDPIDQGAKQFEAAVQNGVAALLSLAARKIQAHIDEKTKEGEGSGRRL